MIIKVNGKTLEELEKEKPRELNIPHHIDRWYDRHERSWVVQLKDKFDNQIGEAIYVYSKEKAIIEENKLREEYKLDS